MCTRRQKRGSCARVEVVRRARVGGFENRRAGTAQLRCRSASWWAATRAVSRTGLNTGFGPPRSRCHAMLQVADKDTAIRSVPKRCKDFVSQRVKRCARRRPRLRGPAIKAPRSRQSVSRESSGLSPTLRCGARWTPDVGTEKLLGPPPDTGDWTLGAMTPGWCGSEQADGRCLPPARRQRPVRF